MKNKKIYIIIASIAIICAILAVIGYFIKSKPNKPENNEPEIVLTENSKVLKDLVFEVDNSLEYNAISKDEFELKSDKWYANLEPMYDQHGLIIGYPECTQYAYSKTYKTPGKVKIEKDGEHNYISFQLVEEKDGNSINDVIVYYELSQNHIMFISLTNNDNSFNEEGLEEIFKVLRTVRINSKEKRDYKLINSDFYHQCHDIDKIDEEEFNKRIMVPTEENVENTTQE